MGGGGSAPKAPKFKPIDIPALQNAMEVGDAHAWKLAHRDRNARFPLIEPGIKKSTDLAAEALKGGQDPGLTSLLSSSGSKVDLGSTWQAQARNTGQPIESIQGRHRGYFAELLAANPPEARGASKEDILQLFAANANSSNQFNSALFGSKINQYNSQVAQGAQNTGALFSGITGLAKIAGNYYSNRMPTASPTLDPSYYSSGTWGSPYGMSGWQNYYNPPGLNTNVPFGTSMGNVDWGQGSLPVMRAIPAGG